MSNDEINSKLATMAELAEQLAPVFDASKLKEGFHGITAKPSRANLPISLVLAQVQANIAMLQAALNFKDENEVENETEY